MKTNLLILEWWEDDYLSDNFPNYEVTLYENVTLKELNQIIADTQKYSPYDYVDYEEYSSKELDEKIKYLVSKGCRVIKSR